MAKKKEHKKKSVSDLEKELREKRKNLQKFKFGSAGSRTRNVKEGANIKKDIARILTELNVRRNNS